MPGITPVYLPNNATFNDLANAERKARIALIDLAWKYYTDGGAREPLKVRPGQPNDNVMLNLSAQAIDKSVSFFAPNPPRFTVPGGITHVPVASGQGENKKSPEQTALEAFLNVNEFDHRIVDIGLSGFLAGHSFMRLYMPDNPAPINLDNPPRMALLDPRLVTVFWDASDIYRVLFYRLTWQLDATHIRRQDIVPTWLYYGATNARVTEVDMPQSDGTMGKVKTSGWEIIEYEGRGETSEFKAVSQDHWEYPFSPVTQWKNGHLPHEFYGPSDLRHADLNDAVNFIASNTARIIKFHAHPKTIGTGVDASKIKSTSIDGFFTLPDGATITNLEMQSDLSSSLAYLDVLRNAFFTQMQVVDMSGMKDKIGSLTNFGVRMLYKDMLDMITVKRSLYGNGLALVIQNAMLMMGIATVKPKDEWEDPLPSDEMETAQALNIEKNNLGAISTQTIQEKLKLDPTVEAERMAEEPKKAMDSMVNALNNGAQQGAFNFNGGAKKGVFG